VVLQTHPPQLPSVPSTHAAAARGPAAPAGSGPAHPAAPPQTPRCGRNRAVTMGLRCSAGKAHRLGQPRSPSAENTLHGMMHNERAALCVCVQATSMPPLAAAYQAPVVPAPRPPRPLSLVTVDEDALGRQLEAVGSIRAQLAVQHLKVAVAPRHRPLPRVVRHADLRGVKQR